MDDTTVLKVKGSSDCTKLASAISHNVYDGKKVTLRAIGAAAVNQAQKAVAIANTHVAAKGLILSTRPGFTDVLLPDATVTGMTFMVIVS